MKGNNKMNKINNNDSVTVTTMGLVTEIKKTNLINHKPTIKRLDKNTYVNIDTGEVKEYDGYIRTEEKSRSNNKTSLSRTKLNNKALIIANYESADRTQILTLTYDNIVTDIQQFDKDFESFIKAIRRKYCKGRINSVKYINAIEFDRFDSIHVHVFLYWNKPFVIDSDIFYNKSWKKGSVYTQTVNDINDIMREAVYVTSYLGSSVKESIADINHLVASDYDEKVEIKRARVSNFKAYARIFRHSENIIKPSKVYTNYNKAITDIGEKQLIYKGSFGADIMPEVTICQEYEYYAQ